MYITIKNTNKASDGKIKIVDELQYFLSGGTAGYDKTAGLSNDDYITYEVDQITQQYVASYNRYVKHHLEKINNAIDTFLTKYPNFTQEKNIREKYYHEFKIPKKKRGEHGEIKWRYLKEPMPELKTLQSLILNELDAAGILPSNYAHAFRHERDYFTNAQVHQGSNHIINIDLKDYFNTITEQIVINKLLEHPAFNVNKSFGTNLATKIANIATQNGTTGQGSPLSPYLANIIMVGFDYKMRKLLNQEELHIRYTRYADDMTFSCKKSMDITHIIHTVESLLNECFGDSIKINYDKTKKIVPGKCFITGCKLNNEHNLTVGWEKKRVWKSRLYNLINCKIPEDKMVDEANYLMGYLSFMHRIEPGYAEYLDRKYDALAHLKTIIYSEGK